MADEANNEEVETPVEPAAEPAAEAPADGVASAQDSEPAAEQAPAETEAAAEAETAAPVEAAAPAEAAAPSEPEVLLTPKERKVAIKTRKAAKAGPRAALTAEERQAERETERAKKAAARRVGRASERAKWKAGAHERTATPAREHETGTQKTRQGVVVSDKADKTITVRIDVARRHRKYQKIVRTSNTLHAHDESNDAHIGDTVVVRESRPLSRSKRWRLVEVVERAK
jgi:small subunit ribosomal protein S17